MAGLDRFALDVGVAEQAFLTRGNVAMFEADDHHLHMGDPARLGAPGEGAVGEADVELVAVEEGRPELGDLFTLRDGVGGDEGDAEAGIGSAGGVGCFAG